MMTGKKRIFTGLLLAVMIVLAGCASKSQPAETPEETMAAPQTTAAAGALTETAAMAQAETAEDEEGGIDRIEAFAEQIQEAVADRDMEAMADLLAYPCSIITGDKETVLIDTREDFMEQNRDLVFGDDLMNVIANVDTADLGKADAGYVMGEGVPNIIFGESPDGKLGITGINE